MGARKAAATVSGGGIDRAYEAPSVALSAAITFAGRASDETTFYVRAADGEPYGRVERTEGGTITIYRNGGRS